MRFAKITFYLAGIWGIAILTPMYFMTDLIARRQPPAITHLEFYFGFVGVALAWQLAFFVIGSDPARFGPMMIPAILEKLGHVLTMSILYLQHQMTWQQLAFNLPDLGWGVLFAVAFFRLRASGNFAITTQNP